MNDRSARSTGWQGVCLIAITYIYFLIFAQFAFLKRLAELGIAEAHLKAVMAAMAAGGILFSLLTPRVNVFPSALLRLNAALATCATAAFLSILPLGFAASIVVSFLTGVGLGLLTVTLVTFLPIWLGSHNAMLKVGLGTGIGYLVCNVPQLFTQSPQWQAMAAAILCLTGIVCASRPAEPISNAPESHKSSLSFFRVTACFTALVWLDSAAFFIIQNTPGLKSGTWQGSIHLWANGVLHLAAALVSAWCLSRLGLSKTLSLAFGALASACLLLQDPSLAALASIFYPTGVSLYSVALVAYPSLLAPAASLAERGRRAGWIYAIAGWCGSAMGIGMGQNLGHVPLLFVAAAGVVIGMPQAIEFIRRRRMEVSATLTMLVIAYCLQAMVAKPPAGLLAPERGRQVYISEGCISCHSQYARPGTPDVLMWGPVETLDELHRQRPPLIGNRRQGPDLSQIGNRRSALWLKAHFYNPAELSSGSFMPSYASLFNGDRGADLVAYLESLHGGQQRAIHDAWHPCSEAMAGANLADGKRSFSIHCATCHDPAGNTRRTWQASFKRLPPDLRTGPFLHLPASDSAAERRDRLARIVKFGLPGTDMPGHEYLSDREIASLSLWLTQDFEQINNSQEKENENY